VLIPKGFNGQYLLLSTDILLLRVQRESAVPLREIHFPVTMTVARRSRGGMHL
jgi:hypothetical protein